MVGFDFCMNTKFLRFDLGINTGVLVFDLCVNRMFLGFDLCKVSKGLSKCCMVWFRYSMIVLKFGI